MASVLGTRLIVDTFRGSAVRVERDATIAADLRADIIAQSVIIAGPISVTWAFQLEAAKSTIGTGFARAIANADTPEATRLLGEAVGQWQVIVAAVGPPGHPADLAARGLAVSTLAPKVIDLLDQAGSASRTAVREELARAARIDREATAALALLELMAIALAVRLARRLSTEVLRPVGILRDSANQLAAGELDHRVVVDRADELGDLAVSFNAMAEAIAGSQRTLTLEANTDSLSGLANRAAFRAQLTATLSRPNRRDGQQAVLFVDLDDFKDVNDGLGHAAGDEVLRVVAQRLIDAVRPGDLVARLGGDEFALLLDDLLDPGVALTVAERVVVVLAEPVEVGGSWAHVGASVGLAMRGDDSTVDGLMREADVAMYSAKGKGKNCVERYSAGMEDLGVARHVLKADVHPCADHGEAVVGYQPMVDVGAGGLLGLEAPVR